MIKRRGKLEKKNLSFVFLSNEKFSPDGGK
jgi:hypothetical protein